MKNILVAVESCESTTIASPLIQKTIELANALSSKVWLLHVVPQTRQPPFNVDSEISRRETAAEFRSEHDFIQHLAKCLEEKNIVVTALLLQGRITKTILKEAERLDAELIMLGCHKHGTFYGALLDTTEEGLLSKCPRPIMFVPEAER